MLGYFLLKFKNYSDRVLSEDLNGFHIDPRTGKKKSYHPDEVWVCHGFSKDEPWKKVKIASNTRLPTGTPYLLYETAIKVAPAKVKDLKDTASRFVPESQRQFFLQTDDEDDQSDAEDLSEEETEDAESWR